MNYCLQKQQINKKKSAVCIFAVCLFLLCAAQTARAEGTTPIYSFDYQGHHIDTYATFSEVDGVKTEGFRYFVKDGILTVVDNRLNTVPDGIFIHYEDGDSYIGVLTKGGRIVSLGTVNLPGKLENFKNSGISGIVSKVDEDSRELIISYENGAMVGYDVVTGEELFRRGGTEGKVSLTDYISQYLDNMVKKDTGSVRSDAKVEAEEIAAIMNEKGYTLEELVDGGVFTDTDALNQFVSDGSLDSGAAGNSSGGGQGESNAVSERTSGETGQEAAAGGKDSKNANTETSAEQKETKAAGSESDPVIKDSSVMEKESAFSGNKAADGKAADGTSGKEGKTGKDKEGKAGETEGTETTKKDKEEDGEAGKSEKTEKTDKTDKNSGEKDTGSGEKETGIGKKNTSGKESAKAAGGTSGKGTEAGTSGESGGVNTEGSWNGGGTEKGSGTASGPEGNGGAGAAGVGAAGTKGTNTETGSGSEASGENAAGGIGESDGEAGKQPGDSADGAEASGEAGGSGEAGETGSEGAGEEKSEKKSVLKNTNDSRYVTVYNPETGSYEIYAVSELMDHPEDPRSENEKLENADNRQIAALLKVKEDENDERGISLYAVIILAVAALMGLAVLYMRKRDRVEEQAEKEKEEKQRIAEMKKKQEQEA